MKRILFVIFILSLFGFGYFYVQDYTDIGREDEANEIDVPQLKSSQTKKDKKGLIDGELFHMIGKDRQSLKKELGEPSRIDKTSYGYDWLVYTDESTNYILYGVNQDRIETIFATGEDVSIMPFQIGDDYAEIKSKFPFEDRITYQNGLSFYTFLLKESDLETNPLIKLSDDLYVVCYFDTFTNTLSSLRIMSGETLIKQRFYEMEYRGSLPEEEKISEEEWQEIEQAMERQIFDLTNIYRDRFEVAPLKLDEEVAEVAYLHSEDMYEHNYFSHTSKDGKGLKERLDVKNIYYLSAGENIAAQHTDAAAAMEGWLNSEGHRDALLYEDYNYLGVGVHRLYYTQNFLLKP